VHGSSPSPSRHSAVAAANLGFNCSVFASASEKGAALAGFEFRRDERRRFEGAAGSEQHCAGAARHRAWRLHPFPQVLARDRTYAFNLSLSLSAFRLLCLRFKCLVVVLVCVWISFFEVLGYQLSSTKLVSSQVYSLESVGACLE